MNFFLGRGRRSSGIVALGAALLLILGAALGQTADAEQDKSEITRAIRDASRALQGGNAASFLDRFDGGRFDDYPELESNVVALTSQSQIASSVAIVEVRPEGDDYLVRVDWLLQLSLLTGSTPIETRQRELRLRVSRAGRNNSWKIIDLAPAAFFRPQ